MLSLAALAAFLIVSSAACGLLLLRAFRLSPASEPSDQFFIAAWTGQLLIGGLLMLAAQAFPLNQIVFAVMAAIGVIAVIGQRAELVAAMRSLSTGESKWPAPVALLVIAIGVSIYSSRDIAHFDTAFYMLPQMIWLEDYGLVTGAGLLHHRFGYNSSWLAFVAPVIDLSHAGKLAAIGGTVACTLLVFHMAHSAARIFAGHGRAADWFMLAAPLPGLASSWLLSAVVSSSPDIPVWILVVTFAWLLLIDEKRRLAAQAAMLAVGAMAIKISAAPLAVAAAIYMLWTRQFTARNFTVSALFGLVTLGSVMAANFVTSGCLLFPAAFTCLPVDWAIPGTVGNAVSRFISQWPFFGNIHSANALDIAAYMKNELPVLSLKQRAVLVVDNMGMLRIPFILLIAAAIVSTPPLRRHSSAVALVTATVGLLYCFTVPAYRFAAGYIGILLGLPVAALAMQLVQRFNPARILKLLPPAAVMLPLFATGILAILFALSTVDRVSDRDLRESGFAGKPTKLTGRLLLPSEIMARQPNPDKGLISGTKLARSEPTQWIEDSINGVKFLRPAKGEQCWNMRRPCTPPGEPLTPLRLRDPAAGPASGFVRAD